MNSYLLQVTLTSVCWTFLHFDITGQIKDSKIGSGLYNHDCDCRVPKNTFFFFTCYSWLNPVELVEFRWGVVQASSDAQVLRQIIVLQNLNFFLVNQE